MAESCASEDLEYVELQSFTNSRGIEGYFAQGKLLSIEVAKNSLTKIKTELHSNGKIMLHNLNNIRFHDFRRNKQEFQISNLQHVTDRASMDGIYNQEGFGIINQDNRRGFSDLSFWSASVATEDIEAAREKSYEDIRGLLSPNMALRYESKIKAQFANSPAFNTSASRYGNFRFSFPFSYLLDLYKTQHCGGEEPQLRILGTDMYKQEIAHYILVHSSDNIDQFRDLPMVPTVQDNSESLPFFYRKDGMLYWRPESTSSVLTVQISEQGVAQRRECPIPCDFYKDNAYCYHISNDKYKVWSIWNDPIFAFHLPNNLFLKVPKGQLLNNLMACGIDEPALIERSKCLRTEEAEDIIQQIKCDF